MVQQLEVTLNNFITGVKKLGQELKSQKYFSMEELKEAYEESYEKYKKNPRELKTLQELSSVVNDILVISDQEEERMDLE